MTRQLALVSDEAETTPDVEALYARYAQRVYRWALRFGGGNIAWAEDITQDVFMSLVKRAPALDDPQQLGGWFYRVTANRCLNELRRQRLSRAFAAALHSMRGAEPDPRPAPDVAIIERGELDAALQAIARLPPAERVAFCMRHLDDLPQQEIGKILGYSKGHVSRLLKRAGSRLRKTGWSVDDG